MYYAPWCSHCNKLKPELALANTMIQNMTTPEAKDLVVAQIHVEDTVNPKAFRSSRVDEYPTVRVVTDGIQIPYTGEFKGGEMAARLPEAAVKAVDSLEGDKAFKKWMKKKPGQPRLVFFGDRTTDSFIDAYIASAELGKLGVRCAHVVDEHTMFGQGYMPGSLVLYRSERYFGEGSSGEEGRLQVPYFGASISTEKIVDWVVASALPSVADLSQAMVPMYLKRGLPLFVVVVPQEECSWFTKDRIRATRDRLAMLAPVAKRFATALSFVAVHPLTNIMDLPGGPLGLQLGDVVAEKEKAKREAWRRPSFVIEKWTQDGGLKLEASRSHKPNPTYVCPYVLDHAQDQLLPPEGTGPVSAARPDFGFKAEALRKCAEQYAFSELRRHVQSQVAPVPARQGPGTVTELVGMTFEEAVDRNAQKDVFVMAYASWCGYCKDVMPRLRGLAKQVQHHDDTLLIARIDGTENELPDKYAGQMKQFPTFFFKAAGTPDKAPAMTYLDLHKESHFLKWLKLQTTATKWSAEELNEKDPDDWQQAEADGESEMVEITMGAKGEVRGPQGRGSGGRGIKPPQRTDEDMVVDRLASADEIEL